MAVPKICMLYYKNMLDDCVRALCSEYGDFFARSPGGRYVFSMTSNKKALFDIFSKLVADSLGRIARQYDMSKPEYYFIINGCRPADNMLLDCRESSTYFPAKLQKLLDDGGIKYFLKEKDIEIDLHEMNRVFEDLFDAMFKMKKRGPCRFLSFPKNMFFIRHARLDCYAVFKAMKYIYGAVNCVNIYKDRLGSPEQCLVSVNDLVNVYVKNKTKLNSSREFINAVEEIRQFTDERIKNLNG